MSHIYSYTQQFEIGRFYDVPCVYADKHWWLGTGWIPVLGPRHDDAEIVNFPHQHWHIDWRFVSVHQYRLVTGAGTPLGIPVMEFDTSHRMIVLCGPVSRRRKCKRVMPSYPRPPRWIYDLETAFSGHKLKDRVCPHRGLPLQGCPLDGDVVTCPGHGLRWNIKTGELVPSPCATQEGKT